LIIIVILSGTLWTYYIRAEKLDSWFAAWCRRFPQLVMWLGFGIIGLLSVLLAIALFRLTREGEK